MSLDEIILNLIITKYVLQIQAVKEGEVTEDSTAVRFGAVPFYSPSNTYLQVDVTATSVVRKKKKFENKKRSQKADTSMVVTFYVDI